MGLIRVPVKVLHATLYLPAMTASGPRPCKKLMGTRLIIGDRAG